MSRELSLGVIALQGGVREHLEILERCGAKGRAVKKPRQMDQFDGLIVPGGESTTIGSLMVEYGFLERIESLSREGMPLLGTCAGLVLMAKKVLDGNQPLLDTMDIKVRRNAFGRQTDSFEADLEIAEISPPPYRAVFIRAPLIESFDSKVEKLAEFDGQAVMARQGHLLVTAFHPELTEDTRIHRYFLDMISEN